MNEAVNTNVSSIGDMGAYVKLLEYNNVDGMILLSELSRRRIRSINKLVRVGRDECAVVVRVDQDKGYIDLSKRRLSDEEKVKCANKFEKVCHLAYFLVQFDPRQNMSTQLSNTLPICLECKQMKSWKILWIKQHGR